MTPEVSIITTSKNYGRYIEECIQSVMKQRQWYNAKINHLIMDGGSTDNTIAVLLRYKEYVNYYIKEGEGQTAALVHAMKIVENKFPDTTHIGWLNADDYYLDWWLDAMYGQLQKEPEDVALICSDIKLHGEVGSGRTTWGLQKYFDKLYLAKHGNTVSQPSVLIRYPIFKELKGKYGFYFNPEFNYCQDMELWYRFLDSGYQIRHLNKLTACLRMHWKQMSRTDQPQQTVERDFIIHKICEEYGVPPPAWVTK